ncbi:MAG: hypothetical protein GTO61_14560 [Gemmatimonadales bacterium]|nr:hypothetical protein [Gemmatimonadales bacterium]
MRVVDASNCTQLDGAYYCGAADPAPFWVVRVVDPGAGKYVTRGTVVFQVCRGEKEKGILPAAACASGSGKWVSHSDDTLEDGTGKLDFTGDLQLQAGKSFGVRYQVRLYGHGMPNYESPGRDFSGASSPP